MNKRLVFLFTIVILKVQATYSHNSCDSRCPDTSGYVLNCALNKPGYLLHQKQAVSQLQCFDYCLRHPNCHVYNFKKGSSSCELFGGLWSFDDGNLLVAQPSTVFSWMGRDQYTLWTMPTCKENTCQDMPSSSIGYCKKPLDMAFLIDTSVSTVGALNLSKNFIAKVSEKFDQSQEYAKIGIVEYNTNAVSTFTFNNFTSSIKFQRFLDSVALGHGKTRYDRALFKAESELFSSQGGARPFAHRVVVLITNSGLHENAENVHSINSLKESFKKKCVALFAVGISSPGKEAAAEVVDHNTSRLIQEDYFN
ncbi:matrilin-2 [Exaiptasia diaphana]|uniref:VWFA domain-containing protein n=1 Tax=Exaiptasia diaphana TaxID=2652724 RepID=A0A913X2W1_EXADI|nr:matrilin-2 [Exaiptasia diaphana]